MKYIPREPTERQQAATIEWVIAAYENPAGVAAQVNTLMAAQPAKKELIQALADQLALVTRLNVGVIRMFTPARQKDVIDNLRSTALFVDAGLMPWEEADS